MKWRALAIVMTIASAVGIYGGANMAIQSLLWTREHEFERLNFAALEVRFVPEDASNLPDLSAIDGVAKVERRLVLPATIRTADGRPLTAVMSFLETSLPEVHSFDFVEGRSFSPDELDAVVIEKSLLTYHGYRPGDTLEIKVGEKLRMSRIVGVAVSPEYFVSTANPDYFIPERGSLGVVFGNLREVTDSLGFILVNDLVFKFEPGADAVAVKRDVLRRLSKLTFDSVMPRERQFSYRYMETQIAAIGFFTPAMTLVLQTLAFAITLINFNRMVAAERREIGALMALGYPRGALVGSYVESGLLLGLLGSALGAGGSLLFRDLFARIYAASMGMPVILVTTESEVIAKGVAYGLVVTVLSAAIPIIRLVRNPPQEAMRGKAQSVEPALPLLGRRLRRYFALPAYYRYGLRNVMRHRGRTAATIGSMALALGVATAYRLSIDSIDGTLIRRFEKDRWQLLVDFLYPVYLEDMGALSQLPGVKSVHPYLRRYAEVEKDGVSDDATLVGVSDAGAIVALHVTEGREPSASGNAEVVLSLGLARKLGAGIGDEVSVRVLNQAHPVRVVGLSSDVVTALAVVPFAFAQEICQLSGKASGVYAVTTDPPEELTERLYQIDFVGKIVLKSGLLEQSRKVLYVMIGVLNVCAAVSIFLAALFILTSINLSVLETKSEFATLKAIGYGESWIKRIVLIETAVYAAGAMLVSVPVGTFVSLYLNRRMGQAWFRVDDFFSPLEFAIVLVPALLLVPLAAYPALRHILAMPISESLSTRTIE